MRGTWLGVDVGSASDKLLNFCLIEQNDARATGSGVQMVEVLDVETWQRIEGMTRR